MSVKVLLFIMQRHNFREIRDFMSAVHDFRQLPGMTRALRVTILHSPNAVVAFMTPPGRQLVVIGLQGRFPENDPRILNMRNVFGAEYRYLAPAQSGEM